MPRALATIMLCDTHTFCAKSLLFVIQVSGNIILGRLTNNFRCKSAAMTIGWYPSSSECYTTPLDFASRGQRVYDWRVVTKTLKCGRKKRPVPDLISRDASQTESWGHKQLHSQAFSVFGGGGGGRGNEVGHEPQAHLAVRPARWIYVLASSGQSICTTQLTAGKSAGSGMITCQFKFTAINTVPLSGRSAVTRRTICPMMWRFRCQNESPLETSQTPERCCKCESPENIDFIPYQPFHSQVQNLHSSNLLKWT